MYRILIVDDTPTNIKILHDILRDKYRISVATGGADALELVQKEPPDLILLDIMMPGLDGYEVCRRLKSAEETENIPIIFVTAKTDIEDEQKGLEMGAVDYITKPISPPITLARIRNHLELKLARDHLEEQVADKTRELQKKIKELEARDRLVHLQTQNLDMKSAGETIIKEIGELLEAESTCLLLPDNVSGELKYASVYSQEDESAKSEKLKTDDAFELATRSYQKKKVHTETAGLLASPILLQGEIFGVVLVGLKETFDGESDAADVLWRMSGEAAMVLRMVHFSDDLKNEQVDFDALLDIAENNL
jgi:DNA-binding response OmpR family regulator